MEQRNSTASVVVELGAAGLVSRVGAQGWQRAHLALASCNRRAGVARFAEQLQLSPWRDRRTDPAVNKPRQATNRPPAPSTLEGTICLVARAASG